MECVGISGKPTEAPLFSNSLTSAIMDYKIYYDWLYIKNVIFGY